MATAMGDTRSDTYWAMGNGHGWLAFMGLSSTGDSGNASYGGKNAMISSQIYE
jgi:hypothetical protein